MNGERTEPEPVLAIVNRCARCGRRHWKIVFRPLAKPTAREGAYTHVGYCPETLDPIFLALSRW